MLQEIWETDEYINRQCSEVFRKNQIVGNSIVQIPDSFNTNNTRSKTESEKKSTDRKREKPQESC